MKVYIDLILFINFTYDFLIMLSVSILFKKVLNIKRVLLSSLIGEIALLPLFFNLSNIYLILLKIILSIIMIIIAFGFNNIFNHLFYFYIITVILGGLGNLITGDNKYVNLLLLSIIGPIIVILYIKNVKNVKLQLSTIYDVIFISNNNTIKLRGIMDTGNNIKYKGLPIIIINDKLKLKEYPEGVIRFRTIKETSDIACFSIDKVLINGINVKCLISKSEYIKKDEVLLNNLMREKL